MGGGYLLYLVSSYNEKRNSPRGSLRVHKLALEEFSKKFPERASLRKGTGKERDGRTVEKKEETSPTSEKGVRKDVSEAPHFGAEQRRLTIW